MKSRRLAFAACLALSGLAAVGCHGPVKADFAVSLHNGSDRPVTAWLTKTGGPAETDWLSPEELATSRAAAVGKLNGIIIPPGKTAEIGPVTGKFADDSMAVLRVYDGDLNIDQMLATNADSPLRVDVPLREGQNALEVKADKKLTVEPAGK